MTVITKISLVITTDRLTDFKLGVGLVKRLAGSSGLKLQCIAIASFYSFHLNDNIHIYISIYIYMSMFKCFGLVF